MVEKYRFCNYHTHHSQIFQAQTKMETQLEFAAACNDTDEVLRILEHDMLTTYELQNTMIFACMYGNESIVDVLLQDKRYVFCEAESDLNELYVAIKNFRWDIIYILIKDSRVNCGESIINLTRVLSSMVDIKELCLLIDTYYRCTQPQITRGRILPSHGYKI